MSTRAAGRRITRAVVVLGCLAGLTSGPVVATAAANDYRATGYWGQVAAYLWQDYGGKNQALDACIQAIQRRHDRCRCIDGVNGLNQPAEFLQNYVP